MKKYMYIALLVLALALILWTAVGLYIKYSVKEPTYSVIGKSSGYEVRLYEPYLVAQVKVTGTYDEALNEGFRVLADYIFGNNKKRAGIEMTAPVIEGESQKIAMTAPVMVTDSQKIAMTAPVMESSQESDRVVSFVMPSGYTLETLPVPNNSRVQIVAQEARKVAVLRFSWFRSPERVAVKKQELISLLQADGVLVKGVPEYAGYDAPFTAPWLVRNEVMVEIE